MISAIIGDFLGSPYEAVKLLTHKDGEPLWCDGSNFTDDTICTISIADWLIYDPYKESPEDILRHNAESHIERGFGAIFLNWIRSGKKGEIIDSYGNGCIMRSSPIAFYAESDDEAENLAKMSLYPTHVHEKSSKAVVAHIWAIRHAFKHQDPEKLLKDFSEKFDYGDLSKIDLTDPAFIENHTFDVTAEGTLPLAIVGACKGGSFYGAMRQLILIGGDSDTLCAVAGPIAEGLYGIDAETAQKCLSHQDFSFDISLTDTIKQFYRHPRVINFYKSNNREVPDVIKWLEEEHAKNFPSWDNWVPPRDADGNYIL